MIARPWDCGITWQTEVVWVDQRFLALPIDFVGTKVLRAPTEGYEDDLIAGYIRAATALCERETGETITPASFRLRLSGFPAGEIVLYDAPVREVTAINYYDGAGQVTAYGGSPPSWIFTPAGRFGKARVQIGAGESWPSTQSRVDAVEVLYDVGYETDAQIPPLLKQGIALVVGELYKNPDLSNSEGQIANVLNLSRFWPRRW